MSFIKICTVKALLYLGAKKCAHIFNFFSPPSSLDKFWSRDVHRSLLSQCEFHENKQNKSHTYSCKGISIHPLHIYCPFWYKKSAHCDGEHFCVVWKLAQVRPYIFMGICLLYLYCKCMWHFENTAWQSASFAVWLDVSLPRGNTSVRVFYTPEFEKLDVHCLRWKGRNGITGCW